MPILERLPLKIYPKHKDDIFSLAWLPENTSVKVKDINPSIINLHWINSNFVNINTLSKLRKPLVWTLHDMWPFTGGCHYSGECNAYQVQCINCPKLRSRVNHDLSFRVWKRKLHAWKNINLTIVAPSNWMAQCARSSSIFTDKRVEVIHNGVNLSIFKPIDKFIARELLGLPKEKILVLFGAMSATSDPRKGFKLLRTALSELASSPWRDKIELVVFGSSVPQNAVDFGIKTHYLGRLNDDIALALGYAVSDVFVAPSVEDNLPNTVVEALACGTPVVAFRIGGMPDMIAHCRNGYLANPFDVKDLAQGIIWMVQDKQKWEELSICARKKAEQEFDIRIQAKKYKMLYDDILLKL
jgi:glycosyltransferase involved in cell wall biosynthesis